MGINIKQIEIKGIRGFSQKRKLELGIPDGKPGSGLTIIIGPNNSGKTTIVEAFNALSKNKPSFSEERRNKSADDKIEILITNTANQENGMRTLKQGGSEVEKFGTQDMHPQPRDIFVLPSRRTFNPYFDKAFEDRERYVTQYGYYQVRPREINEFYLRLFPVYEDELKMHNFNSVLKRVLDPPPNWTIDQSGNGRYFLKIEQNKIYHNSDGLGEGIISLLFIIDSLYDSKEDSVIVIDEPELSLHPSLQRKIGALFSEYARTCQIVLATHSPNFVNWNSIINGARIVRTSSESDGINIYNLSSETVNEIEKLITNMNNPHILGQDAKEIFFLEDKIILVEGQEDVVFYRMISERLDFKLDGEFYGWGVGGAGNMRIIAKMLEELGFRKVAGILDKGKEAEWGALKDKFPNYNFFIIPTEDVRTKPASPLKEKKRGLIDEEGKLRDEYKEAVITMFSDINGYLNG